MIASPAPSTPVSVTLATAVIGRFLKPMTLHPRPFPHLPIFLQCAAASASSSSSVPSISMVPFTTARGGIDAGGGRDIEVSHAEAHGAGDGLVMWGGGEEVGEVGIVVVVVVWLRGGICRVRSRSRHPLHRPRPQSGWSIPRSR